jgi:PAS domain S-box-containing protein
MLHESKPNDVGRDEFRALADALPVLVADMVVDQGELRYRRVNLAYESWFSLSREGIEGRLLREVVGEAAYEAIAPWVAKALAGEQTTFDQLMPYESTRQRYIRVDYIPRVDDAGTVAGVYSLVQDITESKRAEQQLERERGRAQSVLDNMGEAFVLLDHDFRIVDLNAEAMRLEKRPRDAVLGKTHWEAHPEAGPELGELFRRAMEEQQAAALEHNYKWPDGRDTWIDMRAYPVRDGLAVFYRDITERRVAEESQRQSEERHRFLLTLDEEVRSLADPVAVVAATSRALGERLGASRVAYAEIDEANDSASILGGWTDGTATTLPGNLRLSAFGPTMIASLKSGATVRVPDTCADPSMADGLASLEAIGARAIVSVPLVKDGQFVLNLNVHQTQPRLWLDAEVELIEAVADRTWAAVERARAAAALRESEGRFRNMANHAPMMMWVTDENASCTYLNRAWYEFTGQTPEQAVGFGWLDAVHPDDQGWSGETFVAANEKRKSFRLEYRLRRADGTYRWAIDAATPRFGAEGAFLGYIGSVIDINDRKEAEVLLQKRVGEALAARREADALYRAYFENTPEALFVIGVETDGGFCVEEVNPAHEAGVGLKLDDIRGKRLDEILPGPAAERVMETYRHVVETGAIYQYREQFDLTGDPQHWDTSLVPMRDESGSIVRLIGSSRNVTRQVVAEEALRQSQKMEAMGQLTGGVAHDFNNLLTPIVGALDMLQRKGLGGEREQRLIAGAAQSAERAKVLVQRLLAFARRQPLQAVAVDVAKLIRGMADLVASTTGPQILVEVQVSGDPPAALGDPNQLEMALLNLAVNARDAMPNGGTLRITAAAQVISAGFRAGLRAGQYVCVSVADTGKGMDEATLARAVEPFFSTKGVGKGTGLGLSMVHGLASQLGGALTIDSKLGRGTIIELWLPQTEKAPEAAASTRDLEPITARGTALLIDDEELVRLSTADMLSDIGFRVIEVASAEEALAIIDGGTYIDLIVTDHLMPGMSGTDLSRHLRSQRPKLPVLIVSGYAQMDGVAPDLPRLTKPFRKDQLATSISALL